MTVVTLTHLRYKYFLFRALLRLCLYEIKNRNLPNVCPYPHYKGLAELLSIWAQRHTLHFVEALQDNFLKAAGDCPLLCPSWSSLAVIRAALPDLIYVTQAFRSSHPKSKDHVLTQEDAQAPAPQLLPLRLWAHSSEQVWAAVTWTPWLLLWSLTVSSVSAQRNITDLM